MFYFAELVLIFVLFRNKFICMLICQHSWYGNNEIYIHLHMYYHKEPKRYYLNGTIRIVRQDIFDDIAHCSNESGLSWKLQRIYSILNIH